MPTFFVCEAGPTGSVSILFAANLREDAYSYAAVRSQEQPNKDADPVFVFERVAAYSRGRRISDLSLH